MNQELVKKAEKIGLAFPEFLMPGQEVELEKWSVIACDQYTSQMEYWRDVEAFVGDSPSTLHFILPEIYLERDDKTERIRNIHRNMEEYLGAGLFQKLEPGVIFVERELLNGQYRRGVVAAVDLEKYDFSAASDSLIRATEKTVVERIPPRIQVRNGASIESPHILILIDDPAFTVIEKLEQQKNSFQKLYDFSLMKNGGRIRGYFTKEENRLTEMVEALESLIEPAQYREKYSLEGDGKPMLFAMGDGNHSLATAKTHWENVKRTLKEAEWADHPARFALVEIMNLHDQALEFEPIHRVLFNVDPTKFLDAMAGALPGGSYRIFETEQESDENYRELGDKKHVIPFVTKDRFGYLHLEDPREVLTVATFEKAYYKVAEQFPDHSIDYVHGDEAVRELSSAEGNIGLKLPTLHKNELFLYVIENGVLPKKTFSMGEADEKRFYLECRKIVK